MGRSIAGLIVILAVVACGPASGAPTTATPSAVPTPAGAARPIGGSSTTPAVGPTPTGAARPVGGSPTTPAAVGLTLGTERVVAGLVGPVQVTHAGDGSGRLFIVEKVGRIRIVKNGTLLSEPFLDIRDLVGSRESERGLLSVAFHPAYRSTGFFFVNYTDLKGQTQIVRYEVDGRDGDRALRDRAKIIMQIDQPFANHNGGLILFGPDGYLWIGTGDGGSAGDPQGNGQKGQTLLGKMLRIDVNSGDPYAIPGDNPYRADAAYRPEIWAIGLRNPWRYSFDRQTGELYIGDVGQNKWEEIHVVPTSSPGRLNFGWNIIEGDHCFRPADGCQRDGLERPAAEYGRDRGCSVTGGHVYRGARWPALHGVYIYGDYCTGRLWGLDRLNGQWRTRELGSVSANISSFGEDEAGEIYLAGYNIGEILRLTVAAPAG